ncbi:alpha/beta-hydrolase [Trametopsis cervina]|nr:alpha/beta-hydrolase [Trametopsis cervina]
MPTAPVDERGTVLAYEDSGAPAGSDNYTTIILVHGLIFHGKIFKPLFSHAAQHNLRLVLINNRDYVGSTPFSSEEIEAHQSTDSAAQSEVLRARGQELAAFVDYFTRTYHPPKVHTDATGRRSNGIIVLGWSYGNAVVFSLLAHATSFSDEVKATLDDYLRTAVLYEMSGNFLGFKEFIVEPPPDAATVRYIFEHVQSAYFPPITTDLDNLTYEEVVSRPMPDFSNPDIKKTRWAPGQIEEVADFEWLKRAETTTWLLSYTQLRENLRRAVADTAGVLPKVNLVVLWGNQSSPICVWSPLALRAVLKESREASNEAYHPRDITWHKIEGGNHFFHWDHPARFIALLAEKA